MTNGGHLQLELDLRGLARDLPVYRYEGNADWYIRLADIGQDDPDSEPVDPEWLPGLCGIYRPSWGYGLDYIRSSDYPQCRADDVMARQWRRANLA